MSADCLQSCFVKVCSSLYTSLRFAITQGALIYILLRATCDQACGHSCPVLAFRSKCQNKAAPRR